MAPTVVALREMQSSSPAMEDEEVDTATGATPLKEERVETQVAPAHFPSVFSEESWV